MSYLHCPACSRAYNIAAQPSCPYCPVVATPVDATEDIVAAADTLVRAMARATPAERGAAAARMDRLALPAPDTERAGGRWRAAADIEAMAYRGTMLRSICNALAPAASPVPPKPQPLLATLAFAVLERIAPHTPKRLFRAVHARIKVLAA
jgi:hypothetical protein